MKITDMLGRTVYKAIQTNPVITQPVISFATGSLQSGIYIVHVTLNKQLTLTEKVVKQ
jgi:hypothetical protein